MTVERSGRPDKLNKRLAIGGMGGTALFIPVAFIIGEARDGYSHLSEGISALSESGAPQAWAQTGNFIVVGLLIVGLAVGLERGIARGKGSRLGPVLIALFGFLALFMNGIFAADPVGAPETAVGTVHSISAGLGFLAVIAAMFVLPVRLRDDEAWADFATPSRWFGIASAIFMLSYLFAQEAVVQTWHPWTGLFQRVMAGAVMLWLFLLALRLYRASSRQLQDAS